ncbi:MAG: MFS transporter [Betaproteobacteria bacterium]|nr:MFS transporter [Betaproteobacteria bacterium]
MRFLQSITQWVAIAAILTGFMVKYFGWRAAFLLPAVLSAVMGLMFARLAPEELHAPAKKKASAHPIPRAIAIRALTVITIASTSGSLLFNFTTNGNTELFRERFIGIVSDPATLGMLVACVYAVAAFSQVIVGILIDRMAMKPLFLGIVLSQIVLFVLAAQSTGWMLFVCALGFMAAIFGAIPFLDAVVVRYVDDQMRSRVLGPIVKASSFETLFIAMAVIACCTAFTVSWLPSERAIRAATAKPT